MRVRNWWFRIISRKENVVCKVISFVGGDSGTGTTMIAQTFAKMLSDYGKKVLMVSGSGKTGAEYLGGKFNQSLDDLKAGIKSGQISKEDVCQSIVQEGNLSYIPPVRNWFTAKYYPENTFEVLLADLYSDFDYVVVDGGDNVNSALTISAINIADNRFFVITQQQKVISRFMDMKQGVLVPLNLYGQVIVNMYHRDPALFLLSDIAPMIAENNLINIPYVPYGWQAEMESKTLMGYSGFSRGVQKIVKEFEEIPKKEFLWKKSFA